jgi:hypothetical protein
MHEFVVSMKVWCKYVSYHNFNVTNTQRVFGDLIATRLGCKYRRRGTPENVRCVRSRTNDHDNLSALHTTLVGGISFRFVVITDTVIERYETISLIMMMMFT